MHIYFNSGLLSQFWWWSITQTELEDVQIKLDGSSSDICRPGCLYRGMSRIFINWLNILSLTDTASVWSLASLILLYWPQNFLVFSIHITLTFNIQYMIYKIQYYLQYLCRGWQEGLRLSVRRIRCGGCGVNTSKLIIHHV